jgi:hypothetical protein
MQLEKLSINLDQQSTLAKLLAQENIHVIHGNYRTAWFNPQQRVLALPIWKNRGKAVYDLLTGHEVGHALYTPASGWHDAVTDIKGAPKAYLNILEDIRIERKIQDKFPGLRLQFQRGYKVLADENFFGTAGLTDFSKVILIDRINLHSKIGTHLNVPFNSSEQVMLDAAYKCETFGDVVELAKKIYAYQKKVIADAKKKKAKALGAQPKVNTPPPATPKESDVEVESIETDVTSSQDDYEKDIPVEETQEEVVEEAKDEESPKEVETTTKSSKDQFKPEVPDEVDTTPDIEENTVEESDEDMLDALEAQTDNAYREAEESLLANDEIGRSAVYTLNKIKQQKVVIDYKEYYAQWKLEANNVFISSPHIKQQLVDLKPTYMKFRGETDMAAAYMAKEFEMRKAAYQYSRSTVHKTGTLNTNKLHSYKTSEDIFLKSTKLANYQNHGMMMYIDFSGSMQSNMGSTIRQLLSLTLFCRMVNIPYEVYAFTTRVRSDDSDDRAYYDSFMDCEIIPHKFNLMNLMSSRMSRVEYQTSQEMLWNLSQAWDGKLSRYYINRWNQLHSTPLNTCIAYADEMVKSFKRKHGIEKMTTMFLTDGESDSFQVRVSEEADQYRKDGDTSDSYYRSRKSIIRVNGATIASDTLNSSQITAGMLESLGKSTGSTILGFFISEYRNEAVSKICNSTGYKNKDKYVTQMNNGRCVIEDNVFGYDRYFGLCAKYMDVTEDDLGNLVEDGASKGKLKTAFAKLSKQKRVNRILLNGFIDAIA